MKFKSDYRNLLRSLNAAGVRYLIVGGYAVMVHAEPYYKKELDVWVDRSAANGQAVFDALRSFGAPLREVGPEDFTEQDIFYQTGIAPVRVDVITSIAGLEFNAAWERRITVDFDGEPAPDLCREDLLASKKAAARPTDRKHIRSLQQKKR
jgi:hypothetical protein